MNENDPSSVLRFVEPHATGGHAVVTLTREQAIAWQRESRGAPEGDIGYQDDETALGDFMAVHFAEWAHTPVSSRTGAPKSHGWYGIDLDGTIAEYHKFTRPDDIGKPIPLMVDRVKKWLAEGQDVRIFTARVSSDGTPQQNTDAQVSRKLIESWCFMHLGRVLPVTCCKDFAMVELWDDRCIQVIKNIGLRYRDI